MHLREGAPPTPASWPSWWRSLKRRTHYCAHCTHNRRVRRCLLVRAAADHHRGGTHPFVRHHQPALLPLLAPPSPNRGSSFCGLRPRHDRRQAEARAARGGPQLRRRRGCAPAVADSDTRVLYQFFCVHRPLELRHRCLHHPLFFHKSCPMKQRFALLRSRATAEKLFTKR